jgi:hypothetical protein
MNKEPNIGSVWYFLKETRLCCVIKKNSSWQRISDKTIVIYPEIVFTVISFKEDDLLYQEIILLYQKNLVTIFRAAFEDSIDRRIIKKLI